MSRLTVLVFLVSSLTSLTLTCTQAQAACTHYASPSAGGNGLSPASPFHVADFWRVARPGMTLCLLDGTYTGSQNMVKPPSTFAGTASQPITIRALNDGKVHISGGTTRPVDLLGAWGVLEGVNISGSDNASLAFRGTDWVARRVVIWNNNASGDAALGTIVTAAGARNTLEDCAVFGNGRYSMNFGSGNHGQTYNTIRRCWSRTEGSPRAGHVVGLLVGYAGQSHVLVENFLATQARPPEASNSSGEAPTHISATQHSRLFGVINYNLPNTRYLAGSLFTAFAGGVSRPTLPIPPTAHNLLKDMVSVAAPGMSRRDFDLYGAPGTQNRAENLVGIGTTPGNACESGWSGCGTAQMKRFPTLAAAQSGLGGSVWQAVPGICKRVINGTLTTQGLWPWPMNHRIKEALRHSGRAEVDITATMEGLLGPIPAQCRGAGGDAPPVQSTLPAPSNLRVISGP